MKLHYAIPAVLAIVALSACQASAIDVNAPGVGVHVNGPQGMPAGNPQGAGVNIATPNVGVDVRSQGVPMARDNVPREEPQSGARIETNVTGDNRPDQWRYRLVNNRWWYWAPDNRWMSYSSPGGWTYYDPTGNYTTGYGGAPVAPGTEYTAPATTNYYYPNSGFYYYPGRYYYGGPGIYFGWGRGWRGRW